MHRGDIGRAITPSAGHAAERRGEAVGSREEHGPLATDQGIPGHQALRRATAAAHHALDHHPRIHRLVDGDLTLASYAESLAAMYQPHARLEKSVHESPHHLETGLSLSTRIQDLEDDLVELGWPVPELSHFPQTRVETRAAWWGRVYVLEGSRQGAAVIARCVHSALGDTVPSRFFNGARQLADHDALLAILDRELLGHDDLEQAKASARDAFASYSVDLNFLPARAGGREPDGHA